MVALSEVDDAIGGAGAELGFAPKLAGISQPVIAAAAGASMRGQSHSDLSAVGALGTSLGRVPSIPQHVHYSVYSLQVQHTPRVLQQAPSPLDYPATPQFQPQVCERKKKNKKISS